jgi:hypothetical protein
LALVCHVFLSPSLISHLAGVQPRPRTVPAPIITPLTDLSASIASTTTVPLSAALACRRHAPFSKLAPLSKTPRQKPPSTISDRYRARPCPCRILLGCHRPRSEGRLRTNTWCARVWHSLSEPTDPPLTCPLATNTASNDWLTWRSPAPSLILSSWPRSPRAMANPQTPRLARHQPRTR